MRINNIFIVFLLMIIVINGHGQNKDEMPCGQGQQNEMTLKGNIVDPISSAEGNTQVYTPIDPNEIIGTKGYDALGDTLQWVAATASLPYTIYFENDPELATAAAQKVEIRHAYYSIMN